ncbi:hypothetical protein, partial [Trichocoleus sp. ST-U2]|uniref:hypothetical protein n=1 Tax=Trichocoleus sp. ST-U2 TaxID=2933929 RepID=UPI003298737D
GLGSTAASANNSTSLIVCEMQSSMSYACRPNYLGDCYNIGNQDQQVTAKDAPQGQMPKLSLTQNQAHSFHPAVFQIFSILTTGHALS